MFVASAHSQTPALPQVRKIYVETFTGKLGNTELRQQIIDNLRNSPTIGVVPDRGDADAVLKGTGELWISGYVSISPHATISNASPVYAGFLSSQLVGKNGETLWSSLVTPSRYASSIQRDLSSQLVKQLLLALHGATEQLKQPAQQPIVNIRVAGATFPAPLYDAWFGFFRQHHPAVFITYAPIGSEAGLQQLSEGKLTFAASDIPISSTQAAEMHTLQFATVLGAVVPVYNLPHVGRDLRFTPEVLSDIYLGKVRRWNDPEISAINRQVSLPNHEIVIVHRSDGSGTTFVWTDFLSKTVPGWKSAIGSASTVKWPVGQGAQGNDGMAATVANTPYSIGYTELTYAIQRQLTYGSVRNAAGQFIQANMFSLAAAAESTPNIDSPMNAPRKDAYPITSFTWLIIPQSMPDPAVKSAVVEFLEWMLTTGQKECSGLAYDPLPKKIVTRELEQLATFKSH
jgi:phosphate ABC transporter phosphate-binding protein